MCESLRGSNITSVAMVCTDRYRWLSYDTHQWSHKTCILPTLTAYHPLHNDLPFHNTSIHCPLTFHGPTHLSILIHPITSPSIKPIYSTTSNLSCTLHPHIQPLSDPLTYPSILTPTHPLTHPATHPSLHPHNHPPKDPLIQVQMLQILHHGGVFEEISPTTAPSVRQGSFHLCNWGKGRGGPWWGEW